MSKPIEFIASIHKVQTLVDGGIRLTLDMPETATLEMAQLAEIKLHKGIARVTVVPEFFDDDGREKEEKTNGEAAKVY
jgi:ribonucleotide reductase alpha subunit